LARGATEGRSHHHDHGFGAKPDQNNPETRRNGDHGRSCQPDRRKSYFAVAGETLMCCSG
jgi:hypothetical protein